jgi:hypothetical protein
VIVFFDDLSDVRGELYKLLDRQREIRESDAVDRNRKNEALERVAKEIARLERLIA